MRFGRLGQEEGSGHLLVLVIALFLVLLVLFLPPEDREALLGEGTTMGPAGSPAPGEPTSPFLFEKSVGRLEYYPPEGFEHFLPSMHIFSARNAAELHSISPFVVSNNWFVKDNEQVEFVIEDLEHTKNVILAFDLTQSRGPLRVMLNGEQIFEGVLEGAYGPIELPPHLLQERNVIDFHAESVGGAFWRTNKLAFTNVRVIGDLSDVSRTSSSTVFTVSPTEKDNMIAATLVFIPECGEEDDGLVTAHLNGHQLYSSVVECGIPLRQNVPLGYVNSGTNTVVFALDRGDVRIEQAKLDTDLKDVRSFVEYFEVPPGLFEQVVSGNRDIVLEVDFVDNAQRKRGQLNINGHLTFVDQVEPYYTRVLNPYVQPGPRNYLELIPETPLDIVQIRVRYT